MEQLQQLLANPESLSSTDVSTMMTWLLPLIMGLSIVAVILYIYSALTLSAMAKKLNNPKPWLAWIPIANIVLMWQISKTPQWTIICYFIGLVLSGIPFLGSILAIGASAIGVYWLWMICEKLGKPGWWSIFSIVFYPVWLVMIGILAWGKTETKNS